MTIMSQVALLLMQMFEKEIYDVFSSRFLLVAKVFFVFFHLPHYGMFS